METIKADALLLSDDGFERLKEIKDVFKLTLATPIGIELWRKKIKRKNEEKLQKNFDALAAILLEFSRLDERIRSAIRKVKEQGFLLPQSLATC
jgi:hypothetical protein